MKEFKAGIAVGSSLFSGSNFAKGSEFHSGRQGMNRLVPVRIPAALRGDKVLVSLIEQYKTQWSANKTRSQKLRQQLVTAAEADKAALIENLRILMRSNQQAESSFLLAMRVRMRELRMEKY